MQCAQLPQYKYYITQSYSIKATPLRDSLQAQKNHWANLMICVYSWDLRLTKLQILSCAAAAQIACAAAQNSKHILCTYSQRTSMTLARRLKYRIGLNTTPLLNTTPPFEDIKKNLSTLFSLPWNDFNIKGNALKNEIYA